MTSKGYDKEYREGIKRQSSNCHYKYTEIQLLRRIFITKNPNIKALLQP